MGLLCPLFLQDSEITTSLPRSSRCLPHSSSIKCLGYIASFQELKMEKSNIQHILKCFPPRNLKDLQSFLRFSSFYCCFIKIYSKKISSLAKFLKKEPFLPIHEESLSQFHQLKEAFKTSPILSNFNNSLPTIVRTDA
ncbi:hypothetical protein O181_022623 [Austropuccinia psidii MF-1]|uniref:Reverse transcriptase/retrotransposon-derived protein RNase H-like domain-containing protein n=1 Tax=Austropuccinia psidii MF-1 TaxID=1389203 RepID=A0A9Q3CH88_9BASI|nr:hypothetical protein [Austropuccinia psidii MF-1]